MPNGNTQSAQSYLQLPQGYSAGPGGGLLGALPQGGGAGPQLRGPGLDPNTGLLADVQAPAGMQGLGPPPAFGQGQGMPAGGGWGAGQGAPRAIPQGGWRFQGPQGAPGMPQRNFQGLQQGQGGNIDLDAAIRQWQMLQALRLQGQQGQ